MANVRKWSNVAIAMQSALGSALTITGIALGATATVTSTAHGLSNGDYVLLSVQGMRQVDGRLFRVASSTTNNFVLEGEDTTAYDAFSSGSCQKITFGTSITTATTVNGSGGDFDFIDTTTIHGNAKTQIPGLANPATYSFENIWDVSDAGLRAMKTASDSQAQRCFKFTFGTGGQIMLFNGYVGASLLPGGSAQDKVTTQTTVTMFGSPTYYAS
jgi:hypothetical protein